MAAQPTQYGNDEKTMNQPAGKLPPSILISFVALLILAVIVTLVRRDSDTDSLGEEGRSPHTAATDPDSLFAEALPSGTGVQCLVLGRLSGTMRQKTRLEALHPIFRGEIRSRWQACWGLEYSIGSTNPNAAEPDWTLHTARLLELITPGEPAATLPGLNADLLPEVSGLTQRLRLLHPNEPSSLLLGAVIQSPEFDYTGVAALTGLPVAALADGKTAVTAASRILDAPETRVDQALNLTAPGKDTFWWSPEHLPAGDQQTEVSASTQGFPIETLAPPSLIAGVLHEYHLQLVLTWSRAEAETESTGESYAGTGHILVTDPANDTSYPPLPAEGTLLLNGRPPDRPWVVELSIRAPWNPDLFADRSRFERIAWDEDLLLELWCQAGSTL